MQTYKSKKNIGYIERKLPFLTTMQEYTAVYPHSCLETHCYKNQRAAKNAARYYKKTNYYPK